MKEILPGVYHWAAKHPRIGFAVSSYFLAESGTLLDPMIPPGARGPRGTVGGMIATATSGPLRFSHGAVRDLLIGITVVRAGGALSVYARTAYKLRRMVGEFDFVVDCQNGIPFFTPWVLPRGRPVFCLVHHVHDGQFGMYFPPWLAWVGRTLEGPVARWTYRRHAWTLAGADRERFYATDWLTEVKRLGAETYYPPLEL